MKRLIATASLTAALFLFGHVGRAQAFIRRFDLEEVLESNPELFEFDRGDAGQCVSGQRTAHLRDEQHSGDGDDADRGGREKERSSAHHVTPSR